jgi:hypothetical protein
MNIIPKRTPVEMMRLSGESLPYSNAGPFLTF